LQNLITSNYEHRLAFHFHNIDRRGLLIHPDLKEQARLKCEEELTNNCAYLSNFWNTEVYIGSENAPENPTRPTMNLNANSGNNTVLINLTRLGYNVPKIRKKNIETDSYELEESAGELALVKLLADPSRWPSPSAGEGIKKLLETREVITFRNRYINARLYHNIYFANHNVAATVTGRRGSKKTIFGFGGNDQNFPSRGRLSDIWKECVVVRPGKLFFFVDQVSAEDWPVQALSENHTALAQMIAGVNRHYIFASQIFGLSVDELKKKRSNKDGSYTKEQQDEAEMQYYMGKKARHSNNYGMQPTTFSEALAKEGGFTVPIEACKNILSIVDRIDPNVKRIFHKYIQDKLANSAHMLQTPLGRERAFLGLRSGEKNYSILNEAYSYVPQSTVGDNTGLAVCELEACHNYILQDGHDSLCQEIPDNEQTLRTVFKNTANAFKRRITFHNGVEIEIPIEGQIGFNWKDKIKLEEYSEDCLMNAYKELKEKYGNSRTTTSSIQQCQEIGMV
jgi:hypothetical protein